MEYGTDGESGISGNVKSLSYGFHWPFKLYESLPLPMFKASPQKLEHRN